MLDLFDRSFLLHLLLHTTAIGLGIVVGLLLAWKVGLERRFDVRKRFLLQLLLLAFAFAALITLLDREGQHFLAGTLLGLVAGLGAAYLSRAQAKPKEGRQDGSRGAG